MSATAERVFHSKFRVCLYLLLRNDFVWGMLTHEERQKILANNIKHNTERSDYADPTAYAGGKTFDTLASEAESSEQEWLRTFLDGRNPQAVLEIGPGSGQFTRVIVQHPSVGRYFAVDVSPTFLEFIEDRLRSFNKAGLEFQTALRIEDLDLREIDSVVLMNSLHHIPNRLDLFQELHKNLKRGGTILTADPSHYLPRIKQLVGKIRLPGYLENLATGRSIVGTHHFCTLGELRRIAKQTGFRIVRHRVDAGWRFIPIRILNRIVNALQLSPDSYLRRTFLHRWLSHRIMVEFEKI